MESPVDSTPPDILTLDEALAASDRAAHDLVSGLNPALGAWRAHDGSWSVAECLDHLAAANRVYLGAMRPSAQRARERGWRRRGPVRPGIIGRWFVRTLEPPARRLFSVKAPGAIRPRPSPALADALSAFLASQQDVRTFLRTSADLDLAGVSFPNPLVRGVRFSLATGLHVIAAHERRHLWQAWRVRRAAEGS